MSLNHRRGACFRPQSAFNKQHTLVLESIHATGSSQSVPGGESINTRLSILGFKNAVTYETRKSDTTRSGMVRSWSVRRDKLYCIFRTSCAIATKLKIKDYYIMKKIQIPQNSEMVPFPSPILEFRNNLPVPPLPHSSSSETHLMSGSLIVIDVVLV